MGAAIKDALVSDHLMDPDEELVDQWAAVVNLSKVNNDGQSHYVLLCHHENSPAHTGVGLFSIGIDLIISQSGRRKHRNEEN